MNIKKHVEILEKHDNRGKGMYIKEELTHLGVFYSVQKFNTLFAVGENIIVDYPFAQGRKEYSISKKILITAHYNAALRTPGANDNASGVAVLLELIKALKAKNLKHALLRFIFFDLEDGLAITAGSKHYVRTVGTGDVDRVYNLEMVGMGSNLALWPTRSEQVSEDWLKVLIDAAKKRDISVLMVESFGPTFTSDHHPFIASGFHRVCSLTIIPEEDLRFKHMIEKKQWLRFLALIYGGKFIGWDEVPKLVKHHHTKLDRSEFVEETTLHTVFSLLLDAIVI